jgi:hypothetical protein
VIAFIDRVRGPPPFDTAFDTAFRMKEEIEALKAKFKNTKAETERTRKMELEHESANKKSALAQRLEQRKLQLQRTEERETAEKARQAKMEEMRQAGMLEPEIRRVDAVVVVVTVVCLHPQRLTRVYLIVEWHGVAGWIYGFSARRLLLQPRCRAPVVARSTMQQCSSCSLSNALRSADAVFFV